VQNLTVVHANQPSPQSILQQGKKQSSRRKEELSSRDIALTDTAGKYIDDNYGWEY